MEYNMIKEYENMIWKMTKYFYGTDKNDLYQAGVLGLLKAYQKYQNDKNTKFSTYAYDYIFGEMFLLANNRNIKVSKDILKLYKKIETTRYSLAQKYAKIPTNIELSEYLGISLDIIEFTLMSANAIISLDSDTEDARNAYECISSKKEDVDTKILINDGLTLLNEDEKNIIISRYFEDLTQQEVARKLKMTQVKVSRYEKKGINKMRNYLSL